MGLDKRSYVFRVNRPTVHEFDSRCATKNGQLAKAKAFAQTLPFFYAARSNSQYLSDMFTAKKYSLPWGEAVRTVSPRTVMYDCNLAICWKLWCT